MARGEGYLRKRGKVWYFEFMYQGRRYYVKIGAVSKTTAKEIANEVRARIIRGEWIPERKKSVKFSCAADVYINWYRNESAARESTRREHERRVRLLVEFFGTYELDQIDRFLIEKYKRKRLEEGVKKTTVNRELTVLRSILARAKDFGMWEGNLPKIEKFRNEEEEVVRFLSEEESRKLIDACPEWFRPVVIFTLNTGLRAGEVFSLKWEDIDFQRKTIRIKARSSKTKKERLVPMNSTVYSLLKELERNRKEHGFVFTNRFGLPYKYEDKTYRRVFKTACEKAGIKNFRFHDLRHTFASWIAMKSRDIYAVKHLLGHSSLSSTRRYAHLTDTYLQDVVESISDFGSSSAKED